MPALYCDSAALWDAARSVAAHPPLDRLSAPGWNVPAEAADTASPWDAALIVAAHPPLDRLSGMDGPPAPEVADAVQPGIVPWLCVAAALAPPHDPDGAAENGAREPNDPPAVADGRTEVLPDKLSGAWGGNCERLLAESAGRDPLAPDAAHPPAALLLDTLRRLLLTIS